MKKPIAVTKLEATQGRCPGGHVLPNRTNKGRCTPVYCAGSNAGSNARQSIAATERQSTSSPETNGALKAAKAAILAELDRRADEMIDRLLPGETLEMQAARAAAKAQKADELQKIGHQVGRFAAHRAVFKVPEGLRGPEAEEYFSRAMEDLLPSIAIDLRRDLELGDDAQRREARRDVLDILGKRKRESAPNVANVLVLQGMDGTNQIKLPWSQSGRVVNTPPPKGLGAGSPQGPKGESDA